jgi:glycosyltransferase involved in cell wall biosynthesis
MVPMPPPSDLRVHVLIDSLGMGGAEFLLGEFASRAADAGIRLSVGYLHDVPQDRGARRLRERGIEPMHVPVSSLVAPAGHRRVRAHLREVRPDILHTHLGTSDFLGGVAACTLRMPAVSTVHVMEWPRTRRNDVKVELISLARRRCMARVIGVSEPARQWLAANRWGRPDQLVTIHNGVAGAARPGAGREVRRSLGIHADALVVAMLSVLREEKGHDLGIRAVVRARERFPGAHLLVVGDGPTRSDLEALAAPHAGAVTFTGHRDDVMAVLDAADVLLHPSRIDAFPGALLEAMAAGVPVVATAVGGIPDIVQDGVTGVLVPQPEPGALEQALEPLLADSALRRAYAEQGRRRFTARFSVEHWVERMRELYEEVLRERRAPQALPRWAPAGRQP